MVEVGLDGAAEGVGAGEADLFGDVVEGELAGRFRDPAVRRARREDPEGLSLERL